MFYLDQKYIQYLVESSPDIIIAVDNEGTIVFYNDGARNTLHYTSNEMIGEKVTRIYPDIVEARRVMKAMRTSEDHGRIASFETSFRNAQNEMIPVAISGSIIYDSQNHEIGSIGFARDIRMMRRREQLATACEIAVSLAHEINNPLESITNNAELLAHALESHLSAPEMAVETQHLDAIREGVGRVSGILRRLDQMSRKGVYQTRDYLSGKRMADLAAPETSNGTHHEADTPAATPEPVKSAPESWPLAGISVLVLDDDVSVVTSLADLLRCERCIVHTATRPSAALGILRNMKVDAVISDVVMPEMDGYEFYLKVKEEMPELPVILMTAYYYDKDHIIKRSRLKGLEGALFKKPVNPGKLRQMLTQLRHKPSQASRPQPAPA